MIIDNVKIYVKAGDGGNGCVSFRREKYVSHGGPDGGDGGNGGNIVVEIAPGENTLLSYKYRRKFVADNGGDGMKKKFHGKTADDLVLRVPPGTVIKDAESGKVIKDMSECGPFVLCKGGRGGWGNRHFSTPTRQIPRFAKSGMAGEEREVIFELKMLADVGLIGLPNAGKSSILAAISAAKPKIADYRFTTLSPNLGVVSTGEGRGFVAADIPGLIEGAADGAGLGHEFLRHIDRCRLLLHVVDTSGLDGSPVENIHLINKELANYSDSLADRPQLIVANKTDLFGEDAPALNALMGYAEKNDLDYICVSAAAHSNIDKLICKVDEMLENLPPITIYTPDYIEPDVYNDDDDHTVTVSKVNDVFVVEGDWLYRLMGNVNFEDRESLRYFQRVLNNSGVIDRLRESGCSDGDTVSIYDFEFDFVN